MFPVVEVVETTDPAVFSMSAESLLVRQRKHIGRLRLTMTQSTPNIRAGAGNKIQLMRQAPYMGSVGIPECTLWTVFVFTVILLNLVFI